MSSLEYQHILYSVEDPVAVITLNRPEALNAFTNRMLAEIRHALAQAETDEQVVGIIITGAGRGFCPGMDMNALDNLSSGEGAGDDLSALKANPGDPALGDNFKVTYTYMQAIRKPVIAAINGACAGLGMAVALLADLRFVERQAKFSTAFSQRGLIAEHSISWTLPRLIGSGNALDLLWSARKFDGEEAHRLGIAERLVETGESLEAATDYVKNLAANLLETNEWMAASLTRDDFREGVRSFIEKRPPEFKRVSN
jgi:enoyl-CoA hydratase/carnithine racemase